MPCFSSGLGRRPSVVSSMVLSPVYGSAGFRSFVFLSCCANAGASRPRHTAKTTKPPSADMMHVLRAAAIYKLGCHRGTCVPNSTDTASDALGFPKPDRLGLWLSESCHPLEPTVDGSTSVTLP